MKNEFPILDGTKMPNFNVALTMVHQYYYDPVNGFHSPNQSFIDKDPFEYGYNVNKVLCWFLNNKNIPQDIETLTLLLTIYKDYV